MDILSSKCSFRRLSEWKLATLLITWLTFQRIPWSWSLPSKWQVRGSLQSNRQLLECRSNSSSPLLLGWRHYGYCEVCGSVVRSNIHRIVVQWIDSPYPWYEWLATKLSRNYIFLNWLIIIFPMFCQDSWLSLDFPRWINFLSFLIKFFPSWVYCMRLDLNAFTKLASLKLLPRQY